MKKNVLFNSQTALYTLAIFFANVLYLPDSFLFFDVHEFSFRKSHPGLYVGVALALVLFSAVCAMVIQRLFSKKDIFLFACGVLILADTLFRSAMLSFVHIVLLAVSIAITLYLSEGKSFLLKTVFTCVFAVAVPLVSPEASFCQLPLVLTAYGFALAEEKEAAPMLKNKKGNKQKAKNGVKETVLMAVLTAAGICLGALLKDDVSSAVATSNFGAVATSNFFDKAFWIGFVPYVILFVAFVCGYFAAKSKEHKKSLGQVIVQSNFVWFTVLSICLVLYGIIFAKLSASVTVLNVLMVETVVLIYLQRTKSSQKAADGISEFFCKHKYSVTAVSIVWFFVTQFVLKNVQFSLLDRMLSMVGGTL